jgi:cyclohexyl-isocyanide hydratase
MNRHEVLQASGLAIGAAALLPRVAAGEKPATGRKVMAFLLYPEFTALDLVGPHQVLAALRGFDVQLVWKTREPVRSDAGLSIQPTMTFKECPDEVALLFVPGGTTGTLKMMGDAEVLAFLKARGAKAGYVTSVCTGSLVLGAAGLLRGYKATSHWAARDLLADLGAEPVDARVVWDRNRVTGAGVTAGIDFGLAIAAKLTDEKNAKALQLLAEYDPQPPFRSGSPKQADAEVTKQVRAMSTPFVALARAAAEKAKRSW